MKVSGFTFIRDGVRFGYPFVESIRSALPVCDEFIVAAGRSSDDTLERLREIDDPRLRIIETTWNEHCRSQGFVYSQQKMIAQYNCTGDWAFYLEGDEILHEDDVARLREAMEHYLDKPEVEVLAFDYYHFYGDVEHLNVTPHVYRKAARIIRNDIRSIAPDGLYWAVIKKQNWLGRRNKRRNRYPRAAAIGIPIYHYGNARAEHYLAPRAQVVNQYWGNRNIWPSNYGRLDPTMIVPFTGTHPAVIRDWIEAHSNKGFVVDSNYRLTMRDRKHRFLRRLEGIFGWDFSKRHFHVVTTQRK